MNWLVLSYRQVIMFELPLLQFCNEFGGVQRTVAAKHNVILVRALVTDSAICGVGDRRFSVIRTYQGA